MKYLVALVCLFPLVVWSDGRTELDKMLATAVTKQDAGYLVARNAVADLGTNALPLLVLAGTDAALTWQQRLVARICYERIARDGAVSKLRRHDWRAHPGYDVRWEGSMTGPGWKMMDLAVPHLVGESMWYYYVEITWKRTGELAQSPLRNFDEFWPRWCRMALVGQPEEEYLHRAMVERLENDALLEAPDAVELYQSLRGSRYADAVPVLIERYDAFNRREVIGPELFSGRHAELYRGMFEPLLSIADSRHADLLEKFIADNDALAGLKSKLADVRARPAQLPKAEPSFRLGTKFVKTP